MVIVPSVNTPYVVTHQQRGGEVVAEPKPRDKTIAKPQNPLQRRAHVGRFAREEMTPMHIPSKGMEFGARACSCALKLVRRSRPVTPDVYTSR
mmetsp:Transcript_30716/g.94059  ORF Transcript_30716/g.94059 Transcript_30716/m.94059 type:complete len:93 (-) Transcript_30716:1406-1684(-)|eukprot:scaffold117738_cov35-Tisochrysis_lutea.AAC.2